jgi:uncharacterized protein YjbI with pentapeptide repeats
MSRAFKKLFGFGPWRRGPELVIAIDEKGIEAFNNARARNPEWRPDFAGSSLRGMDVSLMNLKAANLVGAKLDGVVVDNLELSDERARTTLARRGAVVE